MTARIVPPPTEASAPFWEASRRGQLVQRRCTTCRAWGQYAAGLCRACTSSSFTWEPVSGRGVVYAFTVVRRVAPSAEWKARAPYVVALVELDEGPRLLTNVVGCDPDAVCVGLLVQVGWDPLDDERAFPVFEPVP